MLRAAVFGTLAEEQPGSVGLEPHVVGAAGNQVGLARQPRHPEAVAHVGRLQRQVDGPRRCRRRSTGMCSSLAVMKPSFWPS